MRKAAQIFLTMAVWIGGQFAAARRADWLRGWIVAAIYVAAMAGIGAAMRHGSQGLMGERGKLRRKDTKRFDRVFMAMMLPLATVQPWVAGWDAGCAGCAALPFALLYPGMALFLAGAALMGWALAVNRHAETTVRIQTERGHTVITGGPYRWVRHPMYVGIAVLYVGLPLMWGSRWAGALSAAIIVLFLWRTGMEDRTLRAELEGYGEYTKTTKYRLVPGLW